MIFPLIKIKFISIIKLLDISKNKIHYLYRLKFLWYIFGEEIKMR